MPEIDLTPVDQIVERLGRGNDAVIPILQAIQSHYRYVPQEAMERVCSLTEITPASIMGVATFYTQFRHRPVGKHIISVCHGTACHVKGAELIQDAFHRCLHIADNDDTDAEGLFTIEKVACLGCCTLAPVIQIDGVTYGRLTPSNVSHVLDDFLHHGDKKTALPDRVQKVSAAEFGEIRIGLGSCCIAQGSGKVQQAIQQVLDETDAPAVVKRVGCVGMCHQTPLVEMISHSGVSTLFSKVQAEDAADIVLKHFKPKGTVRRIRYAMKRWLDRLFTDEIDDPAVRSGIDTRDPPVCAFLGPQKHLATEHGGQIDPTDLDEYLAHDGFAALRQCLKQHSPDAIIEQIRQSGLRGRGGAGFPTGIKWTKVREQPGKLKYVVCNGDEGDPGAFMDRMLLESFPYRIIEGISLAAFAVGAHEGVFYIRAEYPLAVKRINEALETCRERGFLGDHVMGTDFSLNLSVKEGAGAFVCGEETAMLASIEGRRGMPRLRPPFPAESGLWGKPTLINNVETYALVPWILRHGPKAFSQLGTPTSSGTKVFALAGKIQRGGLIEVPMGVTLRQIVEEIGGGVGGGDCPGLNLRSPTTRKFKAVQVGGPSGGCVPAELADTPIDYEALAKVGAIMGSGGLVVLDDSDCMVDIARYFLRFTQDQSCGKCTLCRVGTRRMLDILDRICEGHGKPGDLDDLEQLAQTIRAGSICGLGRTAPNPVLSTLRYFRHEYEEHLAGRCPAGKCKALIHYRVNDDCIGCTLCAQQCPVDAIPMTPYQKHSIDQEKCTRCDTCRQICPKGAIVIE
jgi:NADH-quinone oxidoreductase subunit F